MKNDELNESPPNERSLQKSSAGKLIAGVIGRYIFS